jgi:probable HAF family extracellular repeat protein
VVTFGNEQGWFNCGAVGINAHGDVAGRGQSSVYLGNRSYIYRNGQMTDLGDFGGGSTWATAINDAGQIVGQSARPSTDTQVGAHTAFLWQAGQMTDLGTLGGRHSLAQALNNAGQVVGYSDRPSQTHRHAFLWQNGRMSDLNVYGSETTSAAYAINDAGQIVGQSGSPYPSQGPAGAFLYQNGRVEDLSSLIEPPDGSSCLLIEGDGSYFGEADAINNRGQILARGSLGPPWSDDFFVLTPVPAGRIVNFSFRGRPAASTQPIILGFVLDGGAKNLLLRGVGPALRPFGLTTALNDPRLTLFSGGNAVEANDDWGAAANPAAVAEAATRTGAYPLAAGSKDAALFYAATVGAYTVHIASANGGAGVALAEVYDADENASSSRLINTSALLRTSPGESTAIAGFVIAGDYGDTVLIRAVGPGLGKYGLSGFLPNPTVTLFDSSGTVQGTNAGWAGNQLYAQLSAQVGAFPLDDAGADAMLVASVKPGAYTVHATGAGGQSGLVLIEIYELR